MSQPPQCLAWRHVEARDGFEVAFVRIDDRSITVRGHTAAVERGNAWTVHYDITLDRAWRTRTAYITGESTAGVASTALVSDGDGTWIVDGSHAGELDGALDIDLESSALTNAFPVHRLRLRAGSRGEAPAAFVRASDLRVERLEQTYLFNGRDDDRNRYGYSAPAFDFEAELTYDASSFVVDYPGLAVRVL
jgi:hypothetical protein